uniref:Uncharacterized protein n=1 Tax=Anguilla anguilla TaxID=7936 RepID=A0A0E9UCN5_ANGAN
MHMRMSCHCIARHALFNGTPRASMSLPSSDITCTPKCVRLRY